MASSCASPVPYIVPEVNAVGREVLATVTPGVEAESRGSAATTGRLASDLESDSAEARERERGAGRD